MSNNFLWIKIYRFQSRLCYLLYFFISDKINYSTSLKIFKIIKGIIPLCNVTVSASNKFFIRMNSN